MVAEALVRGDSMSTAPLADDYVRVFKRDWRDGYARGFQAVLESVSSGQELLARVNSTNPKTGQPWRCSKKNGGAMRAVPIGVLATPEEVLRIADLTARVTHDTLEGRFGAKAVALMSHFALYSDAGFDQMHHLLRRHLGSELKELRLDLRRPWRGPVKQPAPKTVHAVYHLLTTCSTLSEVLRGAIRFGGDTDSVASIAVGIGSARMENDLPQVLTEELEPGSKYGVLFLRGLGYELMEAHDQT